MELDNVDVSIKYGYGYSYSYGDGDGDGYGYGYGDGYGYGSGYGSGYGYGYGYGYGDGYGYGYGDGYGYGSGDGYGDGYDDGSGDGYDSKIYLSALLPFATEGFIPMFWRSNMDGTPSNGGSGSSVLVGDIQELRGSLAVCSNGFHGTTNPSAWKGERWWIVGLYPPVQVKDYKVASAKRIILKDLGRCPF